MQIQGKIKMIGETNSFGANGFRKRDVVISTDEQYPQTILVEFNQDKCDLLNNYRIGQPVKVDINLRGREWVNPQGETKYFNSIQGWKIEGQQAQQQPQQRQNSAVDQYNNTYNQPVQNNAYKEEEHDDLPF